MGYYRFMKTTIELDSALLQAAKQRALDNNTSLKQVMEQALRQLLRPAETVSVPIRSMTFGNTGAAWPFTSEKMRAHAYPELDTYDTKIRLGTK
jgi:hypothetical protein